MPRFQFSLARLLVAMGLLAVATVLALTLPREVLLGPLTIALDSAPENQIFGTVATLILGAGIFAFPLLRRPWTLVLLVPSVIFWILLGILGYGINC